MSGAHTQPSTPAYPSGRAWATGRAKGGEKLEKSSREQSCGKGFRVLEMECIFQRLPGRWWVAASARPPHPKKSNKELLEKPMGSPTIHSGSLERGDTGFFSPE